MRPDICEGFFAPDVVQRRTLEPAAGPQVQPNCRPVGPRGRLVEAELLNPFDVLAQHNSTQLDYAQYTAVLVDA